MPTNTSPALDETFSIILIDEKKQKFLGFKNPYEIQLWYPKYRVDLIENKRQTSTPAEFHKELLNIKFDKNFDNPCIIHLFYEFGTCFVDEEHLMPEDSLLGIVIRYKDTFEYFPEKHGRVTGLKKKSSPSWEKYERSFKKGHDHLLRGNCYQFNLTCPYEYSFSRENRIWDFIDGLWGKQNVASAYAHATWLPSKSVLYLSNSPECLFQIKREKDNMKLWSMPIKGSVKTGPDFNFDESWKELVSSEKNQAELYMIADLLRNDLSKIEKPNARVVRKKCPLLVPGILHQYSLIDVKLSYDVSLGKIVEALFPGGSITGAPKKSVVGILDDLENWERGFYCGSTIVLYKEILACSINIRSAVIDFLKFNILYGAGGGITLLSSAEEEFCEMQLKVDSFFDQF